MKQETKDYLSSSFGLSDKIIQLSIDTQKELEVVFNDIDEMAEYHQARVLKAFQDSNVSDMHFSWNTGYGYDDAGRSAVESVFANVFGAESALVRPNIVNGTHAISLALLGLLKRGDKLIYCTGTPYDTLMGVIGSNSNDYQGSLLDMGIQYDEIPLLENGTFDLECIKAAIDDDVRMIAIQRSKGYSWRKSITVNQIEEISSLVHSINPNIIVMVDNCYCEFIEKEEPLKVGADIICGSLIKNPGGGLALSGGYLCGKKDLIDLASYRLTCPGIGAECGLTFGQNRGILQGLFQAPKVVSGALKGAIFCGSLFKKLGYSVSPEADDYIRSDIIQAIKLASPDAVKVFCQGIQAASPIDYNVTPVPAPMPGYDDEIIMAAGTFVQGSSIELSADGPLRDPYIVYFQGGITYEHSKLGVLIAAQRLIDNGLLPNI